MANTNITGDEYGLFWHSQGGDRLYSPTSFELWLKKFFTSGVFEGDLFTTATSGMNVSVSDGYANVDGKVKFFPSDNVLTISAAGASTVRIDTIVIERNDGDRNIYLKVVEGTPTINEPIPTPPVREDGIYQLVIAEVYVGEAVSEITQADITDKRLDDTVCGYVAGTVEEMSWSQITAQWTTYIEEFKAEREDEFDAWVTETEGDYNEWIEENQADFLAWYQRMKDQLSEDAAGHLQNEIDELSDSIDEIISREGSAIKVTFDEDFEGETYTLTNGVETYTGEVPSSLEIEHHTKSTNTTFTVSVTLNNTTFTESITLTNYYGVYEMNLDSYHIYGAEWDGTSTTAWTRTDRASNFTDPIPAVNNGDGSSPFDNCYPWSEMTRENRDGGVMVKIPKYYYKWTRTGNTMKLQISDTQLEGYYTSPAHADRGDGKGERDYVYVGAYHCASDYKSKTGVAPLANKTRAEFRSGIHNLGTNIWQYDYAMYWTIMMLYLVEFADWNSQAKIGYGCGNNSSAENNGLTDAMTYHTGTNAANRTTYGHIRYRWIEGLWDNVYDWCDGIYFSGANIYGIKNPASFSDTSGGTNIGTRPTTGNYISKWTNPTASGFEYALYPSEVNGSESTYVCDYCNYDASGVVLFVGGDYSQNQYRGAFRLYGSGAASNRDTGVGSRIQELP